MSFAARRRIVDSIVAAGLVLGATGLVTLSFEDVRLVRVQAVGALPLVELGWTTPRGLEPAGGAEGQGKSLVLLWGPLPGTAGTLRRLRRRGDHQDPLSRTCCGANPLRRI